MEDFLLAMVEEGDTSSFPGRTNVAPLSETTELEEAVSLSLFFLNAASCNKSRRIAAHSL